MGVDPAAAPGIAEPLSSPSAPSLNRAPENHGAIFFPKREPSLRAFPPSWGSTGLGGPLKRVLRASWVRAHPKGDELRAITRPQPAGAEPRRRIRAACAGAWGPPWGWGVPGEAQSSPPKKKKHHPQRPGGISDAIVPPRVPCEPRAAATSGTGGPSGLGEGAGGRHGDPNAAGRWHRGARSPRGGTMRPSGGRQQRGRG